MPKLVLDMPDNWFMTDVLIERIRQGTLLPKKEKETWADYVPGKNQGIRELDIYARSFDDVTKYFHAELHLKTHYAGKDYHDEDPLRTDNMTRIPAVGERCYVLSEKETVKGKFTEILGGDGIDKKLINRYPTFRISALFDGLGKMIYVNDDCISCPGSIRPFMRIVGEDASLLRIDNQEEPYRHLILKKEE
jgi:hypothetical protein